MTLSPSNTTELQQRVDALEHLLRRFTAMDCIRRCVTQYMFLCDHLDANTPLAQLGDLFTRNAVWEGKGARYTKGFGAFHGREAITEMFGTYMTSPPHFRMNAHFLCSEKIVVDADGLTADAGWLMLQTSTFSTGASHLNAARLELRMALEDNCWRIAHFQTENIFSRPIDRWEDNAHLPVPRS